MASKLKILVDYPCDVFCDFNLMGEATPGNLFVLELRKGKYLLDFKVKNEIKESYIYIDSFEYIMESNDEDDLLKINLINNITVKHLKLPSGFDIFTQKDIEQVDGYSSWSYYLYISQKEDFIEIPKIKGQKSINLIFTGEKTYIDYFDTSKKEVTINIEQEITDCEQTIFYDYRLINSLGLIIYTNDYIYIYNNDSKNSNDRWQLSKVLPSFGYIYEVFNDIVFFIKDKKFGLYDLKKEVLLVNPLYDRIFNMFYRDSCEFQRAFTFYEDKTFYVENNGLLGKIDINGNIIVPAEYQSVFNSFLGMVVEKDGKWGLYNKDAITEWYDDIFIWDQYIKWSKHHDIDSSILFYKKNNKIGFWDCQGKRSKILYDEINPDDRTCSTGSSNDRIIRTRIGDKHGLIDIYGNLLIQCKYDEIEFDYNIYNSWWCAIYIDFIYYLRTMKKTKIFKDWLDNQIKNGNLQNGFDDCDIKMLLSTPKVVVRKGDYYGVVNFDGFELIEPKYVHWQAEDFCFSNE